MITSSVKITFVVAEITFKSLYSLLQIDFVVVGVTIKVVVITSSVVKITFVVAEITFKVD